MRAYLLALLVACSSSSSSSPPTTPSNTPPPATGSATQASTGSDTTAGPGLGENCGPGDTCGRGRCKSYYGIAGARGPQFKTCEIECGEDKSCPDGLTCRTIADGPGSVCR